MISENCDILSYWFHEDPKSRNQAEFLLWAVLLRFTQPVPIEDVRNGAKIGCLFNSWYFKYISGKIYNNAEMGRSVANRASQRNSGVYCPTVIKAVRFEITLSYDWRAWNHFVKLHAINPRKWEPLIFLKTHLPTVWCVHQPYFDKLLFHGDRLGASCWNTQC